MQVAAQNRLAFDELYDRQFKFVFNAAYKRLNADQSADIAKEVFVRLWTRKSDLGSFYCWSDLAYGLDNAELAIA